jgi:hypothetical protein
MRFHGRTAELRLLDELWRSEKASLLILYGRRRIGKTRLLTHWALSEPDRHCLYWVADPTSTADQLRLFSQFIYNFATPGTPAPANFSFGSWQQALEQVARLAEHRRFALLLDEFTYLLEANPGIAGVLQNAWDHLLKTRSLMLIISGSHLGMMRRHALSPQAPLYGRATAQLHLQPLPFGVTKSFFPGYQAAERVALYAMFGGVPAYWERIEPKQSISDNIRRQLLTANNLMQDELRLLLQDFLVDSPNYVAILRAIASDCRTQKEIAGRTGLPQGHVSKYLDALREAGFVQRRVPVTESEVSRKGRYHITDPYLRFYYRFLATRQGQLALGVSDQALAEIKRHLLDFIGAHTWEELCREWLLRAAARGKLPFLPDQVGSVWTPGAQADVAGVNHMERTLILGECKWSPRAAGVEVLQELVAKTPALAPAKPGKAPWSVFYLGFSRDGWRPEAIAFARQFNAAGENWKGVGLRLLTLDELDTDLNRWVAE